MKRARNEPTHCVPATRQNIAAAAALLREGGVVAFPTETVYGLGALAFDARAVARIFEIKQRPAFDPLIVHVADRAMLERVADIGTVLERALIERFWPGALTLVVRKRAGVPALVTAGLPTVAVRMPSHPVARALLHDVAAPLAAPSANPFGALSPTQASHVTSALGDRVDLVLDGGPTGFGLESTIVTLEPEPMLLRPGAIPIEEIEAITGPLVRRLHAGRAPLGPGQLRHHYAPRTPLRIVSVEGVAAKERLRAGFLAFSRRVEGYAAQRVLSSEGDMREAASHLFEFLHELDALGLERIDVEPVPESGLGLAIMDRLRRAATG